jgi:hypothetical protein
MGRVAYGQQGAVRGYWLGATPSTGAINTFLTIQTVLPNAAGELKVVVCFIIPGRHAPPNGKSRLGTVRGPVATWTAQFEKHLWLEAKAE